MISEQPDRWLADAAADAVIAERRRMHWLGASATESSTMVGLLVDMAEAGIPVGILVAHNKWVRGVVTTVGADFVAVEQSNTDKILANIASICVLQPDRNIPVRQNLHESDRRGASNLYLIDVLATWAADRTRVVVTFERSPIPIVGNLVATGIDVIVVHDIDAGNTPFYSSLPALSTVATGSG